MSNRCIDILCLKCGSVWCTRGCGTNYKLDKKVLQEYKDLRKNKHLMTKNYCYTCKNSSNTCMK